MEGQTLTQIRRDAWHDLMACYACLMLSQPSEQLKREIAALARDAWSRIMWRHL